MDADRPANARYSMAEPIRIDALKNRISLKLRWPVWLVIASLVVIFATQRKAMGQAAMALTHGDWLWMIPAALMQALYYFLYGVLYWSSFRCVGVSSRSRDLVPIVLSSLTVSVAAPGGAAVGATLFIDDAIRRGQSGARAAVGALVVVIAELLGVACISIFGLNLLLHDHQIAKGALAGVALLVLFVAGLIGLICVAIWLPQAVRKVIDTFYFVLEKISRALKRTSPISRAGADRVASDIISAATVIRQKPLRLLATFVISLVMFAVMLGSLACLFPAFGQSLADKQDWSRMGAAFVVGMLFWIVSPAPQGIGFVEAAIALTLSVLGMQKSVALWIALSFRAFAFWIPLICGGLCLQAINAPKPARRSRSSRNVRAVSVLIGGMGVINVLSAVHPALHERILLIHRYFPLEVTHGSRLASAVAGFVLIMLASGLWRRKRAAWLVAVGALFISIIAHLIKGLDYEEASLAAALLIYLVSQQSKFYASSDRPSASQGIRVAIAAAVFTVAYGVTGLWVLDHQFKVDYGMWAAIKQTIAMFTEFDNPGLQPTTHFGDYFRDSIYGVAAGTMTYALLMILRPVLYRPPTTQPDRAHAARIAEKYGKSPLARYALFDDKSCYFTSGGSLLAYAVIGRTAIVLGDPIGPDDDAAAAIRQFTDFCQRNDWRVGYYQTRPDYLPYYADAGFHSLCIGHDAIVNLKEFTTAGGSNKQIRWSLNRFTKLGYHVEVLNPPHSETLISKLRAVSDDWLLSLSTTEKRFSLGWFDDEYLQTCQVMVVIDPDLRVSAFANILPRYGDNATTIDLMRRRRDAETGIMEYLFVKLLEWAREEGYKTFNLGLSPLSGVGEAPEDPAVERVLNYVYEHLNQFYSFKGLHTFKSKFKPYWEPRYLIYPTAASLPQIGLSVIHANSGGTYLQALFAAIKGSMLSGRAKRPRPAEADAPAVLAADSAQPPAQVAPEERAGAAD